MIAELERALAGPPAATVADVIARMRAIDGALPRAHGVAEFNRLYLTVTEDVQAGLAGHAYAAPEFLRLLDVRFARLYFDALAADRPPPAWRPLFESAERRGVLPLQFAFAGMNAHINRDLPVALVETWRETNGEPRRPSPEHDDFLRVNGQLAAVEERVKRAYLTGFLGFLDRRLGRIDDVAAMWNVARARDAAWTNGTALWRLRDDEHLARELLASLDRTVGFAGRGLLTPAGGLPLPRSIGARRFARLLDSLGSPAGPTG